MSINSYPSCKIYIEPTGDSESMNAAVRRVCKLVVKEWANVDENIMEISKITGGITNLLLKVSVKSKGISLEDLTVRIFGPDTESVIDRNRELQVLYHLSTTGFGAELIGLFENGMVQSFIVARTLTPKDLYQPDMAASIAQELRRLHETEAPLTKVPQLWSDLSRFLEKASTLSFDDPKKQEYYERISFKELGQEIDELKNACEYVDSPLVFAHNDLLSGNVMCDDNTGKIYFIDYEYSSYNPRGYDIANHFNEYAGFDCDYNLYPGKDAQFHFFRHYLHGSSSQTVKTPNSTKTWKVLASDTDVNSEAELEKLYIETNVYAVASHLYWALWAIVQAKFSHIDFDYLEYFSLRYNECRKRKTECFSMLPAKQNNTLSSGV